MRSEVGGAGDLTKAWIGLGLAGLALVATPEARAQSREPDLLAVGAGAYNVLHESKEAEFRVEYRFSYRFLYIIRPIVGVLATAKASIYPYAGFRFDAEIGHIVLTPEAAVGHWSTNDGKNLGGPLEFKTGGEIAWRFSDNSRLGFLFDHISNAGIYKKNPGVELAMLMYSIPLNELFGH